MTTPLDPIPGPPAKTKGDLGTRTLSAIVMVAVAGAALWLGGWMFTAFVVAVGLGVLWEWWGLVQRIAKTPLGAAVWMLAGVSYVGVAMAYLINTRSGSQPFIFEPHPLKQFFDTLTVLATVISVDVGAYFAGRSIGGPKIAPRISPSKTWAGLAGGAVGAAVMVALCLFISDRYLRGLGEAPGDYLGGYPLMSVDEIAPFAVVAGILTAIIAQSGDFFESWMKRRAGVKDSGSLIPGHGGLFDRVDGLLAVLFVGGVLWLAAGVWA